MDEPTREGQRLIEEWQSTVTRLNSAKSSVQRAETDLLNSTNALGRWVVPDDIDINEPLCVWHGDSLIQVTKTERSGLGSFVIRVRKSGRKTNLMKNE